MANVTSNIQGCASYVIKNSPKGVKTMDFAALVKATILETDGAENYTIQVPDTQISELNSQKFGKTLPNIFATKNSNYLPTH